MKNFLIVITLCFSWTLSFAQLNGKVHTSGSLFGSSNISQDYQGNLTDISDQILADQSQAQVNTAIQQLKQSYQEMTGQSISDGQLDVMLDPTQNNYDTWMSLYEAGNDTYLLRSIIINIKSKL